jgi:hypothetical protein
MLTNTQHIETQGTSYAAQGEPAKKRGLLSGRTAIALLILFGLILSVAFPFGLGVVLFVGILAVAGALTGVGIAFVTLLRELLGKTPAFGYAPTTAYMAGKKMKKKAKEGSPDEEKKDAQ